MQVARLIRILLAVVVVEEELLRVEGRPIDCLLQTDRAQSLADLPFLTCKLRNSTFRVGSCEFSRDSQVLRILTALFGQAMLNGSCRGFLRWSFPRLYGYLSRLFKEQLLLELGLLIQV